MAKRFASVPNILGLGILGGLLFVGLYQTSLYSYPLFHTLAELFSIVIAISIFILAWNTRHLVQNHYFLMLGIAFLFIAQIDLIHALAYRGMNIFREYDSNLPTQLWIAARYVQSGVLLAAPFFLTRKVNAWFALAGFAGLTLLLLGLIFGRIFPVCYVEGVGLTPFKIISEYIISAILVGAAWQLFRFRHAFDARVFRFLLAAIGLTIGSELAFTFYVGVYDLSNQVGHLFKIAAFYFFYRAIVEAGLQRPFDVMFREIQQADQALRAWSDRYQAILAAVPDIVMEMDNHKVYTWANQAGLEFFGADVVGQEAAFYLEGEQDTYQAFQPLFNGSEAVVYVESCQRRRDGAKRLLAWWYRTLKDAQGNVTGALSTARDITEHKRVEEALRKSEEHYRLATEAGQVAVWQMDLATGQWEIGGAVEQITGYTAEEIGTQVSWQGITHPEDRAWIPEAWQEVLEGRRERYDIEHRLLHKDGSVRWVDVHGASVRDENGQVTGILGATRDITARKQAEEALRQAQLAVEATLAAVSSLFVQESDLDWAIDQALVEVGHLLSLARLFVVHIRPEQGIMAVTHEWCAAGVSPLPAEARTIRLAEVPRLLAELQAGRTVYVEDPSQVPADARWEMVYMDEHLGGRCYALPIRVGGDLTGFLVAHDLTSTVSSVENETQVLQTVVGMVGSALDRASVLGELERRVADRTRELSTLYDVVAITAQVLPLETIMDRALEVILDRTGCTMGAIHLLHADGPELDLVAQRGFSPQLASYLETVQPEDAPWYRVLTHGRLLLLGDGGLVGRAWPMGQLPEMGGYLGLPIRVQGRPIGVLSLLGQMVPAFTVEETALLTSVTERLGKAVNISQLRRRAEEARILEERQRLARDLHDAVTQSLYSLTLFTEAAHDTLEAGQMEQTHQYLERIAETAHQSLKEMRLLIYELRSSALESAGLVGALRHRLEAVERRAGMEAVLVIEGDCEELPPPVEEGLYRIAEEALNNVLKHAAASRVELTLKLTDGWVELAVRDNGRGFAPQADPPKGGMGLENIRRRVAQMGGELTIRSTPGVETEIFVRVAVDCGAGEPAQEV